MVDGAKSCPFCGSDALRVKSSGRWGWFVSCECAAVGPSAGDRDSAIQKWNTRVEPKQGRLL
jgi:Lar family restriction alleviation protein